MRLTKWQKDAAERILWTALAAGISTAGVYVTELPSQWIAVGTVIITVLKTIVATRVGDPNSAALMKE